MPSLPLPRHDRQLRPLCKRPYLTRILHIWPPCSSARFLHTAYRSHEQWLLDCIMLIDILRLSMFGKSWQNVQSEAFAAGFSAGQFASCRPRPGSIDFSHLLEPYYCSCKPSAPPSFRCHSSPLITSIRLGRFKSDRFYVDIHLVPRRTSSSLHRPTRPWVCFPKFKVLAKSKMEHAMQSDSPHATANS